MAESAPKSPNPGLDPGTTNKFQTAISAWRSMSPSPPGLGPSLNASSLTDLRQTST